MTETLAQIRARIERESRKALDLQWACGLRDELGNWVKEKQPDKAGCSDKLAARASS